MGKNYDKFATNRTVKHLREKTVLLGAFYCSAGVNGVLAYLLAQIGGVDRKIALGLLGLGIVMLAMVPLSVLDRRREERDLFAVIGAGFIWLTLSGFFTVALHSWAIPVAVLAEGVCIAAGLLLYRWKKTKGRRR